MLQKITRLTALLLLATLVACLAACGPLASVQVIAVDADEDGIAPDTEFLIKSFWDPTDKIEVSPEFAYDLTPSETAKREYTLKPLSPLAAGDTVTITVRGKAFTFQVRNTLILRSHFPTDGAKNVPMYTGIVLRFSSANISLSALKAALTIQPEISGLNITQQSREGEFALYFEGELEEDTTYTVTIDQSLTTDDGLTLSEPASFSFTTISRVDEANLLKFQMSGSELSVNSLASEPPLAQVYLDQEVVDKDTRLQVTLRRFPSAEEYRAAMEKSMTIIGNRYEIVTEIDTEGLETHTTFDITPMKAQEAAEYDDGRYILQFPEPLPEGHYAADFTLDIDGKPVTRQLYLQSSNLAVFNMITGSDLMLWVNDTASGKPVSGAQLEMQGAYTAQATTDKDGVARLDALTPPEAEDNTRYNLFTVTAGDQVFVDASIGYYDFFTNNDETESHKYLSYLFTDRSIYRTSDTIKVWGMIRPRDAGQSLPELKLILDEGLAEAAVTPGPKGTFTAELSYESAQSSRWPTLSLTTADDAVLRTNYLEIEDYVKPVYTADADAEQPVYLLGESAPDIAVNLRVRLFDGTPAPRFPVVPNSWQDGFGPVSGSSEQVTDDQGNLRTVMSLSDSADSWYPRTYSYEYTSASAQSENFYLHGEVNVIHRDLLLQGTADRKAGTVEVTTHRVDVSGIESSDDLWNPDNLRGAAVDTEIQVEVHHLYYDKIPDGTYYDFIERVAVEKFRFEERDDIVENRSILTKDGTFTLQDLPTPDMDNCYYVRLKGKDSLNRETVTDVWMGSLFYRGNSPDSGTHRYQLSKVDNPEFADGQMDYQGNYTYPQMSTTFADTEDVSFQLLDNDTPLETMSGRMLYAVVQDAFTDTDITDSNRFTLPFGEHLLPNYVITGAYFDGKHIFALENTHMNFDPARRELEVEVLPGKDTYQPADELDVTVRVTDKTTGEAAADAEIVLSVVDEAMFALREQDSNILRTLYESIHYPYVAKYTSYLQFDMGGPGEKGGGGGGDMRTDFADTAYFATATTDSSGKATFQYKLPDNITSWRLTSLSLTDDNHAGNAKVNVSATKDFFVNPIVSERLLEGDDCVIGLYGMGRDLSGDTPASYTIKLEGDASRTEETSANAGDYASVSLGKLSPGDYTVTISGECAGHSDSIRLPFSVQKSGLEISLVKSFDLKDGIQVDPLRYPVSVLLYGSGAKTYSQVLQNIAWGSGGARMDAQIARKYAATIFRKQGAEWYDREAADSAISGLEGPLLRLFPYGEWDLELTAKAALAAPDIVSPRLMSGLRVADMEAGSYSGRASAVYLGQALAGDKLTVNLENMLDTGKDLDFVDKMYLLMALAVSGQEDAAAQRYKDLVTPKLVDTETVSGSKGKYVDVAESAKPDRMACTAAASMAASMLKTDDAEPMIFYLQDKKSIYDPFLLEQMYYLTCFDPAADSASFRYTKDGKEETVKLDEGVHALTLDRQQLAEANLQTVSGQVFADVYYTGAPNEAADQSRNKIGLTKRVEPVDGPMGSGALVKITLTPDFSQLDTETSENGLLVIDDYIPSGMRYETYKMDDYDEQQGWYLDRREGQRIRFGIYGASKDIELAPIVYYVRCAATGEYVVESAHISSASSDLWGESGRSTVTIP